MRRSFRQNGTSLHFIKRPKLQSTRSYKTPEEYNASGVFLSFFEIKLFWPDYLLSGERFPDR